VISEAKLKADNCATCEFTLGVVFDFLNNKDNREEIRFSNKTYKWKLKAYSFIKILIRNVLETICYHLPSTVSDRCETFIHERIENLIDLIVENLGADEICRAMSMCDKKTKPVMSIKFPL